MSAHASPKTLETEHVQSSHRELFLSTESCVLYMWDLIIFARRSKCAGADFSIEFAQGKYTDIL